MEEIFISKIHINKVRHLENVDILLSETERKHLILTGKNGSGKTSLLEEIKDYLGFFLKNSYEKVDITLLFNSLGGNSEKRDEIIIKKLNEKLLITFNKNIQKQNTPNFNISHFSAKRTVKFETPKGVLKIPTDKNLKKNNSYFIQQLVNIRYELLEAKVDEKIDTESKLQNWLDNFKNLLTKLFHDEKLRLEYSKESYNYYIVLSDGRKFNFNQLSDGYSSIIDIVSEILMSAGDKIVRAYDLQGIVLIDEIETHLHIDLQKKILPFLTSFFPKIQFIVTTHSPFVLSSVNNAVIFDLETKQRVEDLSGYSVEGIVESYFDVDQYSDEIKAKLDEYETLLNKSDLTSEEKERKLDLKIYFKDNIAKTLSPELSLRIKELETQKLVTQ